MGLLASRWKRGDRSLSPAPLHPQSPGQQLVEPHCTGRSALPGPVVLLPSHFTDGDAYRGRVSDQDLSRLALGHGS